MHNHSTSVMAFRAGDKLRAAIETAAKARGVSRSNFIRSVLQEIVTSTTPPPGARFGDSNHKPHLMVATPDRE